MAFVTASWFFVKKSEVFYLYIKIASIIAFGLFLYAAIISVFWVAQNNKQAISTVLGVLLSITIFFLTQSSQQSLDPKLLDLSQHAENAWAFWNGLSQYGHNLVVGSLMSVSCLAIAVFLSILMGIYTVWSYISQSETGDSLILSFLMPFRIDRGGILAFIFCFIAWLFQSGLLFRLV